MTLVEVASDQNRSRIPLPAREEMNAEQQAVHDEIVAGRRGRIVGPLRAVIHNPDLARDWSSLGVRLRYNTSLGARRSELAIIITARHWGSSVEWSLHAGEALKAGISSSAVEAIATGELPRFESPDEAVIYEFARQLLTDCQVSPDTYAAAREHLGDVSLIELTALIGYYSMVAMMLNAHEIPLPKEFDTAPELSCSTRVNLPSLSPVIVLEGGR